MISASTTMISPAVHVHPNLKISLEAILVGAIKKSAVRVVELFQEWDVNRSGGISKKELAPRLGGRKDG